MAITRAEFETARKVVQTAIFKYGDIRTALLTTNRLEADAGTLYVKAKAKNGVVLLSVSEI